MTLVFDDFQASGNARQSRFEESALALKAGRLEIFFAL
jgi:hypothetical protein